MTSVLWAHLRERAPESETCTQSNGSSYCQHSNTPIAPHTEISCPLPPNNQIPPCSGAKPGTSRFCLPTRNIHDAEPFPRR